VVILAGGSSFSDDLKEKQQRVQEALVKALERWEAQNDKIPTDSLSPDFQDRLLTTSKIISNLTKAYSDLLKIKI